MASISTSTSNGSSEASQAWLLYAVSFWGGFQIMVLEMCGFRVLQTNLGSSVIVTGTLLTLIMVLLSAGYYTGGRLSRRFGSARPLLALLLAASVYTELATALLMEPLGGVSLQVYDALPNHPYLQTGLPAALLTVLLYGPPVFVMSMISPFLIRMQSMLKQGADAGVASGFFMSLSTVGSIAGTMLASYVLIPFFGVTVAASASNAVFLALLAFAFIRHGRASNRRIALSMVGTLLFAGACLFGLHSRTVERDPNIVYQAESTYGRIKIQREKDEQGRELMAYYPSSIYTHSLLYPNDPLRSLGALIFLVPALVRPPENILVLGSAAGGILRKIERVFPNAHVTGVDIDPQIHRVALDVFGVNPRQATLVPRDARVFVRESRETFDFIIVDLFSGEFIPPHCITQEFFELVRARLAPGGGMFVNTNMNDVHHELQDEGPFRAVRHVESTLRAAGFPSLFENSFFHSIFAFPDEVSTHELRAGLLRWLNDTTKPASIRSGAGLAAYTTTEVPTDRKRYRPFTDRWTPDFLIEHKSNERAIYSALATDPAQLAASPSAAPSQPSSVVAALALREHLAQQGRSGDPSLVGVDDLISSLNALTASAQPSDLDIAARYFRFSDDVQAVGVPATTHWAKLAAFYADLQRLGYANEYEALLPLLQSLVAYLPPA
ncbi:MAG: hypothetical protein RL685_530 [Pseudomonadota bacterium]|jgi:spermidine synthase